MIGERLTGGTFGETEITRCGNSISLFFQQQRWSRRARTRKPAQPATRCIHGSMPASQSQFVERERYCTHGFISVSPNPLAPPAHGTRASIAASALRSGQVNVAPLHLMVAENAAAAHSVLILRSPPKRASRRMSWRIGSQATSSANRSASTLPPDSTMTTFLPATSRRPASNAARPTAPPGSTTSFSSR